MGVLGQKPKFKVAKPTIRIERTVVNLPGPRQPAAAAAAKHTSSSGGGLRAASGSPRPSPRVRASAPPLPTGTSRSSPLSTDSQSRKRKARSEGTPRRSPVDDRPAFGDDSEADDEDWEASLDARKRQRTWDGSRVPDPRRELVSSTLAHPPPEGKEVPLIHAAQVASLHLKCTPSLGVPQEEVSLELQYPGLRQRERYELVSGRDMIDAVADIIRVVQFVAETYLADDEAQPFLNPHNGLVRQLVRASSPSVSDYRAFLDALDRYNTQLLALQKSGAIARNLGQRQTLPTDLVYFILDQVYDRTVAPKVDLLSKYKNGTDNVYGELLHPFISDILVRRCRMTSDQVFVDLGSGVGNVVLQAALDIGCESWGCEMMENACNLADAQQKEFRARCRLWGVSTGKVHLEKGDFTANDRIHEVLKRADVVLVNNQAFTSDLNDRLIGKFLDLKTGCKVISLKSFVHEQKNALNDIGSTILDVEHHTYPEGYVSWTNVGGTFCISTKK